MKFDLNTENINYLKLTYTDKDGFTHCIKSAIRFINSFEILASAKFEEENINIITPQEVELGIACDNGLYIAKTTLTRVEKEKSYLLFSMRKPTDMEYRQKREYFRVKLQEDANIIFEEDEQEIKISAITYDISANGVRIELEESLTFPEEVNIFLFLPQKTISVKAKYIRTDNEDDIIKASFRFENIAQQDLDYISQICFQKQLEERRKNLM